MKNMIPTMKRVCAYTIDIVLVLIISTIIANTSIFNKNNKEYQKVYNKYLEEYNTYIDFQSLLTESYKDNEINQEEYDELLKINLYKEDITKYYEDTKISQEEYEELTKIFSEDVTKFTEKYNYDLGKLSIATSIITIVITFIYFGIIQYLLHGQTIGKKLLKLQIVSSSDKKLNIINYLLRTLIVNNVLLNIVGIIFLIYSNKTTYIKVNSILNTLVSTIEVVILFLVLTREDGRGLHDILFNTKVISTNNTLAESDDKIKIDKTKVIEGTIEVDKSDKPKPKKRNKNKLEK